jgi:hypothetical protein
MKGNEPDTEGSGVVSPRRNDVHKIVKDHKLVVENGRRLLEYSRENEYDESNVGKVDEEE